MTTHAKPLGKFGPSDLSDSPYYSIPASESKYLPRLNLKLVSGAEVSLPYPYLGAIELNGDTLSIEESKREVVIHGRHLEKLYKYLIQHRVDWIQESDSDFEEVDGKPYVAEIILEVRI